MSVPKSVTGLACVLAGLILTRVAVHYSHPTPGMNPAQIWHAMTWVLRVIVIAAWIPFVYGCGVLAKAFVSRSGRHKQA
jgi:hypothetical protein